MSKRFYRCENEYGPDPCEFAKNNYKIPDAQVNSPMGGGNPRCPGKTASGAVCGRPLVLILSGPPIINSRYALFGGLALAVAALLGGLLWWLVPDAKPQLVVLDNPVVFPKVEMGAATGTLRIRNDGTDDLVINGIDASPPAFSAMPTELRIAAGDSGTVSMRFKPVSSDLVEGTLILRSNDPGSPTSVSLVANRDPWWVYRRLESSSTILSKEP